MAQYTEAEQLEQAIQSLHKGTPLSHVLAHTDSDGLKQLITLAHAGLSIPVKDVPTPARQYKFMALAQEPTRLWLRFVPFFRMAVMPLALVLVLLAGWVSKLAVSSTPDQKLFSVKHAYEQLRLEIARSPEAKADLQIAMTQRRLTEAQTVLRESNDEVSQETALRALATQTQTTLESVKQVQGSDKSVPAPIAEQLTKIADQQQQLLETLPTTAKVATTADTTATSQPKNESLNKATELVATAHEETLATLKPAISTPVVNQPITLAESIKSINVKDKTITIGKDTTVLVTTTTIIKLGTVTITLDKLTVGTKVNIKAVKNASGQLEAKEIIVTEEAKINKVVPKPTTKPVEPATPEETQQPDPNTATAGFILESPQPEYVP